MHHAHFRLRTPKNQFLYIPLECTEIGTLHKMRPFKIILITDLSGEEREDLEITGYRNGQMFFTTLSSNIYD